MLVILAYLSMLALVSMFFWGLYKFEKWERTRIYGKAPEAGQTWRIKGQADPWATYTSYEILEVLDGWCKYESDYGSVNTATLNRFTRLYERVSPEIVATRRLRKNLPPRFP